MQKPRLKIEVRWGFPLYVLSGISFLILLALVACFLIFQITLAILILPLVILNLIFLPIHKTLFLHILKKENTIFSVYKEGITIKDRHFLWGNIKSISFDTGIIRVDRAFRGFKFPYLQRIYILDDKGMEHSCIIDIDYSLKQKREENNLNIIRNELVDMGKANIISDWAERY